MKADQQKHNSQETLYFSKDSQFLERIANFEKKG